jgi:hypothetical protein
MLIIDNSRYPKVVRAYRERYDRMVRPSYLQLLKEFTSSVILDSIIGLDYKELLAWEHRHVVYTKGDLPKPRAELPIDIIKQEKGRCGEFALLYNGLLLTNGYVCRLLIDCSQLKDRTKTSAGDHVWNELSLEGRWLHVDPTEERIDQPQMYARDWKKDVNLVYAVTENAVIDVTQTYKLTLANPGDSRK